MDDDGHAYELARSARFCRTFSATLYHASDIRPEYFVKLRALCDMQKSNMLFARIIRGECNHKLTV